MASSKKEYAPRSEPRSVRGLVGPIVGRAFWAVWVALAIVIAVTSVDRVQPGQVAVIKNNLTGAETLRRTDGVVVHMPLGITRVYVLDQTQQPVRMTREEGVGDREGVDDVKVKTSDGTNVFFNVEFTYRINPEMARTVIENFRRGDAFKYGFMRSLVRSKVRDALGELSLQEIAEAANRQAKAQQATLRINDVVTTLGLTVESISITNPIYNPQYKAMLAERARITQKIRNQEAARITALSEKAAAEEAAWRETTTTLRLVRGEQAKRVIDAQGDADKLLKETEGKAYELRKEGDRQLEVALQEARAIEQEGLKKAEGIRLLAEAYRVGGLALVRETLAKKYTGKQIRGKPYSLESRVDRLRIETESGAAAARAARPGGGK